MHTYPGRSCLVPSCILSCEPVDRIAVKRRCGWRRSGVGERGVTRRSYSSRSSQSRRQRGITSQCPVRRILRSYCGTAVHDMDHMLHGRACRRGSRFEDRAYVSTTESRRVRSSNSRMKEDKTLRPGRGRSYVSWPPMCSKKFSYFHDRPSYTVEDTGVHSEFTGA